MKLTKNVLLSVSLATLALLSAQLPAAAADAATDAEQVKQQAMFIPDLQRSAASAAGYQVQSIEVMPAAHQITISVIDSKLNDGAKTDRHAEAAKIADAAARAIAGKPEFAQVMVIHVDYVKRSGSKSSMVQSIDFNKAADGTFQFHQT
jgi:hypothetical protein